MADAEWKREDTDWYTRGRDAVIYETDASARHTSFATRRGWYRWHEAAQKYSGPHKTMREAMEATP
jgi:hypothetical protein